MDYITLFDIVQSGYQLWFIPLMPLPFIMISLVVLVYSKTKSMFTKIFFMVILLFSISIAAVSFIITYSEYKNLKRSFLSGECLKIRGEVKNFQPMKDNGKGYESFKIKNKIFKYSSYIPTSSFNETFNKGGPIREGMYVRIIYCNNKIVKLEKRN